MPTNSEPTFNQSSKVAEKYNIAVSTMKNIYKKSMKGWVDWY